MKSTEYNEEDFLMLAGIQHFIFCRRRWALIHIEQQWEENVRTVEGTIFHERVHNENISEKRKDIKTVRGMRVHSNALGVYGVCDAVELKENSIIPIEYKKGAPQENESDIMQLLLQAICLEEMMCAEIPYGFLYYGETRHRLKVEFTKEMRERAEKLTREMHGYFSRSYTPIVKPSKSCNACSMKEICLPKLCKQKSASNYISEAVQMISEEM